MNHPVPPASLRRAFPAELLASLKAAFAERVSISDAVRAHHGRDESPFDPQLPDAVVFARTTGEVQTIVKLCAQYNVPVIPYGKKPKRLPCVLSPEEVLRLLNTTPPGPTRLLFQTLYACGLRINEALHLRATDIDSARMVVGADGS